MGAAVHWEQRMRPSLGLVNEGERRVRVGERPFRASNGESEAARGSSPGLWVGSNRRRRKRVCAGLDERVGVGYGKRAGYQLTV